MRDLFELGKHRLPNDRGPDAIDLAVDQVRPFNDRPGRSQAGARQQLFVERAGDLGHEDRVVVVGRAVLRAE